jgi:hypothetical protein
VCVCVCVYVSAYVCLWLGGVEEEAKLLFGHTSLKSMLLSNAYWSLNWRTRPAPTYTSLAGFELSLWSRKFVSVILAIGCYGDHRLHENSD